VAKKQKPRQPAAPLTGKQKSYLRSLAHPLKPVVQIGHQGLTAGVVSALEAALDRHELIKVKVAGEAEVEVEEVGPEIERATHSQLAQIIGHTLVLYRRREKEPKIQLPKPKKAKAARAATPVPAEPSYDEADADADEDEDLE
jgi:RNA-binding protein